MGYCSAWMDIFENRLSWQICSFIRPVFPSLYFGRMPSMRPRMFFQSTLDGCLVGRPSLNDRFPIVYEKDINQSVLFPEELENAERFRAEMEKRGTKVIITNVPFDENSNQKKRLAMGVCDNPWLFVKYEPFHKSILLAKALNVPLLAPTVAGLETIDGGHLTAESSEKFSRVFFKELSELPLVKTLSLHRLENPEN